MRTFSSSAAPRELILVADPKAGLRVGKDGIISNDKEVDVKHLADLINSENAAIRPLFCSNEEWLAEKAYFEDTLMGVNQPLDLSIFLKVTVPDKRLESLAEQLRKLPIVQSAYIKPGAELPSLNKRVGHKRPLSATAATDDFTVFQEYLNAAPSGINALYAWEKEGGKGKGVNIIDIEGAWQFLHEDLLENPSDCAAGVSVSKLSWRNHGTAVLGMLGGDHNGFGIAGICPEARVRTVSIYDNSKGDPSPDWSSAAAIRSAANLLSAGDIILIELHYPGPANGFKKSNSQFGYIPIEWWPCDMAAIKYANKRGIIVVEAGGNGKQNLCDEIYDVNPKAPNGPFPPWWSNPFKRNPIDTGAILVGAGAPPERIHGSNFGPDRSRLEFSNYGKVIDTQAWGEEVATCGGNNALNTGAKEIRRYTRRFDGTSSASAMVAGALGCLQGVLRAMNKNLDPAQARKLLQDNLLGSPQQDGVVPSASEHIGPRPDLRKLIDHLTSP
jgi:hypothetical protein